MLISPFPAAMDLPVDNPLFWAVIVGWIISVIFHEFAHGLAGHLGGDYTVRERGGLSLNPIQYIDPMFSLLIPAIILAVGGIPLPGGVTYIRRDLLRGRFWQSIVSLAGPLMNLLLFFACLLPLHPALGLARYEQPTELRPLAQVLADWPLWQVFLSCMAGLQLIAAVLNLAPVPPLDGFNAIAPFLPYDFRERVGNPPISTFAFFAYFMVLWKTPLFDYVLIAFLYVMRFLGFGTIPSVEVFYAYFMPFKG